MSRYWFRQKRAGLGATPSTWQGWALAVAGGALCFAIVLAAPYIYDNRLRAAFLLAGLATVVMPMAWIAHAKTEGGWRRRTGRDD